MLKITTLVENTAVRAKFRAEHGLSMLIEKDGETVLFDTGQTDALIHNAKLLGVDLSKIDKVILSHGHYDHVGGLKYLLDYTKPTIYAHPEIFRKRYSKLSDDGNLRYIGIEDREFFEKKGARFVLSEEPIEVAKGIWTSGFVKMTNDFESVDKNFVYEKDGELIKDEVEDDLSVFIEINGSLFVLFGCAHRGIINIMKQAESTFNKCILGFLGGTHLGPADEIQREKTIEALKEMDLRVMGPSHCTGLLMTSKMYCEFGDRVVFNNVGVITVVGG
ncbi:MBL fold metallo-hydrolase [Hippea maritima]|uniref:Beta-lactamase domain protein n=1 Tax=Hippea maritima (strain ATCC 700847 / DSM 10411 / MH2) TaxID=760142 RepID=F2LTU5_HIPMA|nr:MBL fold metallo-hydrolase [Hippea maritima]AEA34471.1 beta-lactamase domain protein [Hippea maritima DSM 10411]